MIWRAAFEIHAVKVLWRVGGRVDWYLPGATVEGSIGYIMALASNDHIPFRARLVPNARNRAARMLQRPVASFAHPLVARTGHPRARLSLIMA